jgi:glyoxylase-like metal-dependent hydrolase (beta-lactamase superfamily II)/rhodanese-related sulfurtransferase
MTSETSPITIDARSLRDRLEHGAPTIVLDVRPSAEHNEWCISGSESVDAFTDLQQGHAPALDSWSVVTVCGAGKTSLLAALQLRSRGIDALSLEGGMAAWTLAWNTADVSCPATDAEIVQLRRTGKGCLSYMIGSDGDAAVVDPSLDLEVYEGVATARGWTIRHVLETHIHADHLSRGRLLAEQEGATLHLPRQPRTSFAHSPIDDGNRIEIGESVLEALHVPGHTPESTSFLLDKAALLTGDTLFLRSIGRPDLHGAPDELQQLSRRLYRSLQRLRALPASTVVLPGHADRPLGFDGRPFAGSLGDVLEQTDWLRLSADEFVEAIRRRIPEAPANHRLIVRLNEQGLFPGGQAPLLEAGANRCALK